MSEHSEEELRETFDHFDSNGDGRIDAAEFWQLLKALDAVGPGEDPGIGFRAVDTDNSGWIEFDEFARWFEQR